MSQELSIGWSDFACEQHRPYAGNSYCILSNDFVLECVRESWDNRVPGHGESSLTRKVVVPLYQHNYSYFRSPFVQLTPDLPVRAKVTRRQEGEDYYVETYVDLQDCDLKDLEYLPVKSVSVVCYSKEALLENNGKRSTECDWEIVCIIASNCEGQEPMRPLTMARNELELPGGTKSHYTPKQYAEAIMYWSANKGIKVMIP